MEPRGNTNWMLFVTYGILVAGAAWCVFILHWLFKEVVGAIVVLIIPEIDPILWNRAVTAGAIVVFSVAFCYLTACLIETYQFFKDNDNE